MDVRKSFKVVVVGGGVAGLTLANMLQKFDIDFVVLEAHGEIAPPIGASIGLFPNGLRILDQIANMCPQARVSIPFFDRQWLSQILYDKVEDKSRVLLKKKVGRIEHDAGGVRVTTLDKETFDGSIVVGADGIYSSVRKGMNRMAQELRSGPFQPGQEDEIPCYYNRSFGIAQNVDGWARQDQSFIFGDGSSALVSSGRENRVYWFKFVCLPEEKRGGSIPKYTKEDKEAFAKEYVKMAVTETLKFNDIYKKKLSSTLTPLHELVYRTWFYRRVVLPGDSAHKSNPIGGQGGNGAVELAAELINALIEARDSARFERARFLVKNSNDLQALMASEDALKTALARPLISFIPAVNVFLPNASNSLLESSKINHLPVPFRPRAIPFEDERPAVPVKPATSDTIRRIYAGTMLILSTLAAVTTPAWPATSGIKSPWQHVAPVLMYTIEGHHAGNQSPILGMPSVMAIGFRGLGISRVVPSYALVYAFSAYDTPGLMTSVKCMLERRQGVPTDLRSSFWKLSALFPILVGALSKLPKAGRKIARSKRQPDVGESDALDRYETHDMPYLQAAYICAFLVQEAAHGASGAPFMARQTVLGVLTDAITTPSVFLESLASLPSGARLACVAWVLQNLYATWDLRRLGYVKNFSALKAAVGVALGQILVRPGATWAGLWYLARRGFCRQYDQMKPNRLSQIGDD
ncbi:FAD/NAD(P)-binding domain-containing protein [Colletotrichum somersetense]|nr:FAD/NAD(P)-binding domain-containing protein [Colletotrichum somersetense]